MPDLRSRADRHQNLRDVNSAFTEMKLAQPSKLHAATKSEGWFSGAQRSGICQQEWAEVGAIDVYLSITTWPANETWQFHGMSAEAVSTGFQEALGFFCFLLTRLQYRDPDWQLAQLLGSFSLQESVCKLLRVAGNPGQQVCLLISLDSPNILAEQELLCLHMTILQMSCQGLC